MRRFVVAAVAVVALTLAAGRASAQHPRDPMLAKTAFFDSRTGNVIPTVTRLHPVIGSLNRTSHLNNPLTHRARYTGVLYNPILGSFGTKSFRR
jgi:hypothetical protein